MGNPHKIVLIGFSPFERATFESFFRLVARRPPGYELVADPAEAILAVVNADEPITMRATVARKPCQQVMLIGASDGGTGWTVQHRPLNLMKVLNSIEKLLTPELTKSAPASVERVVRPTGPALRPEHPHVEFSATEPFTPLTAAAKAAPPKNLPVQIPLAHPKMAASLSTVKTPPIAYPTGGVRVGAGDFAQSRAQSPVLGAPTQPSGLESDSHIDHILVVDDSDIALKFMRNRITRFGFRADLVSSGEEALGRIGMRSYKFVFLDVMMEGLDGYQTCRAIKQRKYSDGKPPVVVMLTSRGGTIDKIRGTLAGCDAYLTKPLNERDLIAVLAKHDRTVARGFQDTNLGNSEKSGFGTPTSR
jgi:two-component system, cell cycle response regulator